MLSIVLLLLLLTMMIVGVIHSKRIELYQSLYMNCTGTIYELYLVHEPYMNCTNCYLIFLKEAHAIFLLMIVQFVYSMCTVSVQFMYS